MAMICTVADVRARQSTSGSLTIEGVSRSRPGYFDCFVHVVDLSPDRARAIADAINGKGERADADAWQRAAENLSAENGRLRARIAELKAAAADACARLRGES